ncbi:MAG: helicase-related protein [Aquisalimonadaceae bacterium]
MTRPDLETVLRPLKPFQRRTVDHAFDRLFIAQDSTSRFLVADEVGLGKTLVARGIIGRAIDHMWDDVERIDIVYICSNQSIARSNLPKLQVSGEAERSLALATRLTMLATELAPREGRPGLGDSKINFISFTPGTSFNMGHYGGMADERRILFHLLEGLVEPRIGLMNLLQGAVTRTGHWRTKLDYNELPLDPDIRRNFQRRFTADHQLRREMHEVIHQWFRRRRAFYPDEARYRRNQLTGELRRLLAEVCVQALEPDLIILDEFQRFKPLLESPEESADPAARLARALFHAKTPEGHPVRTLLLSATPYKLYTADAEIEQEDHYQDFLATTAFLLNNDDQRLRRLKAELASFSRGLKRAAEDDIGDIMAAKQAVERSLTAVMARTERVSASAERDAMLTAPEILLDLRAGDIRQYFAADALFRSVGDSDPMTFWKSAPYLPHFMQGYKFNDRLTETLELSPEKVLRVLNSHDDAFLKRRHIERWAELDPGHAKLRELVRDLLDTGLWKLLWMPPTIPYWPFRGAYKGQEDRTKTLLFSAWNVVPDVVSAVLSYEAERRMVGGSMKGYLEPDKQQRGLLRLTQPVEGTRSRHRLLLLLLPCLVLADEAHPLAAPAGMDRRDWVRSRVDALLSGAGLPDPRDEPVDERWEWAVLLLIDPNLREFLTSWRDADPGNVSKPNPEVLPDYIDDLLDLDPTDLGRRPAGLAELVTDIALGAPGVLAARTLGSAGVKDETRRVLSINVAHAFWKLFNRPAVIRLLNQLSEQGGRAETRDTAYWRQVLAYCADGNLQSVLDETWHMTWEQHAWSEQESPETISARCAAKIAASVEPRPSRVHTHFYEDNGNGGVDESVIRLRTTLALRFGNLATEEGVSSQDAVRAAFNSPFRPFVLASTSIGQEGLDFHPWCHRLVHWNLPGNPVDLEQREGRVHRYKGHAVRRNVAASFAATALDQRRAGENPWDLAFTLADAEARARGESDLVPFWMAPGAYTVQRRVPTLPFTSEVEAFRRLKRQLAAYRVVFGQPRQEELLSLLDRTDLDDADVAQWAIDLSPKA